MTPNLLIALIGAGFFVPVFILFALAEMQHGKGLIR